MTLIESLHLIVGVACGVMCARWSSSTLGWGTIPIAFVLGAAAPTMLVRSILLVDSKLFSGPEGEAPCLCGLSGPRRYELHPNHRAVRICACGNALIRERGRMYVVTTNGRRELYLRWRPLKGWVHVGPLRDDPYRG